MDFASLPKYADVVIAGGGITGAGVFREAVRMGLKAVLVEQKDYAWGTSSKSSKLIHGGLRYLKEGKIHLTMDSVIHRERLIREAPGLVSSLGFHMPVYENTGPGRLMLEAGLTVYDLISRKKQHRFIDKNDFTEILPDIYKNSLKGGFYFHDAQVDDARLVQRLINESIACGGIALNYTALLEILRNDRGFVSGVTLKDKETGKTTEIITKAVINATGAWAESIMKSPNPAYHLRPLRGSHLVFPKDKFPINDAVTIIHPSDKRPLFMIPWESVCIFGTTDIDHKADMNKEPFMTKQEAEYLLEALTHYFGALGLGIKDAISSFAGIRPVLSRGHVAPSKESREHAVWEKKGLITVTGGKLTTFRKLAWDSIKASSPYLPDNKGITKNEAAFTLNAPKSINREYNLSESEWERLSGRYGNMALEILKNIDGLHKISGTDILWSEIKHSAENEQVRHLTDLLQRRSRIALLLPKGGDSILEKIGDIIKPVLGWDESRWNDEVQLYRSEWQKFFRPPAI